MFRHDLFSKKMGPLLFDGIEAETDELIKHQLILLLIAERPLEWKVHLEEYIPDAPKDSYYLYSTVEYLSDTYEYAFASDTELSEMRHLLKMGFAKHEYGGKPNLGTMKKILNRVIPKRFAVDFKTTYRNPKKPFLCNGFTLGSHGKYFEDRTSTKNIQFPYSSYTGHFCLGIIYNRVDGTTIDETKSYAISELHSIASVVKNFEFFVAEKWRIASDKSGSGNTANIGSINRITDISAGKGMFSKLGEEWFDDYWMNHNKITIPDGKGGTKKITALEDFVKYRNGNVALIVPKNNKAEK